MSFTSPHSSATHGFLGTPRLVLRDRHLLVGVALILAALSFARYRAWSESFRRPELKGSMQTLQLAGMSLQEHQAEHQQYPREDDWAEFASLVRRSGLSRHSARAPILATDDGWGYPLQYKSDGTTFELRSLGRDGIAQPYEGRFCGRMASIDDELILSDSGFVTYPPGMVH